MKELIIDAETLLNRWSGLKYLKNTRIFLSAANYLTLRLYVAKSMEYLNTIPEEMDDYIKEHKSILDLSNSSAIESLFEIFMNTADTYMNTISISKRQNLELVIYKGFVLDKTDDCDLAPVIEEIIAFAEYKKEKREKLPIYTMNEPLINSIQEFNFKLDVRDARKR